MKWLPFTFALLALAGCADDSGSDGTPIDSGDDGLGPAELQVPTWKIGDVWEYQTSNGVMNLVVSDDQNGYTLDTDDKQLAFFDSRFDISYIGGMDKTNLIGSQDGTPVQFFDFPLQDNKTWTTSWDGEILDLVAHDLGNEKFHIQAFRDGALVNEYQYSNATRFFDWISFTDGAGSEVYRMDLISRGNDWTGQLIRIDATVQQDFSGPGGPTTAIGYSLPDTEGDLYLELDYACTTGTYLIAIGPFEGVPGIVTADPNSNGFSSSDICPVDDGFAGIIGTTPTEETWGHVYVGLETINGNLWARQYEYISL